MRVLLSVTADRCEAVADGANGVDGADSADGVDGADGGCQQRRQSRLPAAAAAAEQLTDAAPAAAALSAVGERVALEEAPRGSGAGGAARLAAPPARRATGRLA